MASLKKKYKDIETEQLLIDVPEWHKAISDKASMISKKSYKFQSVILPIAAEDLKNAAKWYNKQTSDLGKKFFKRFRIRLRQLRQNP